MAGSGLCFSYRDVEAVIDLDINDEKVYDNGTPLFESLEPRTKEFFSYAGQSVFAQEYLSMVMMLGTGVVLLILLAIISTMIHQKKSDEVLAAAFSATILPAVIMVFGMQLLISNVYVSILLRYAWVLTID